MTRNEVLQLKPFDRLVDTRDSEKATVISVNECCLRVRYDDSLSSNYIDTDGCGHLTKEPEMVAITLDLTK